MAGDEASEIVEADDKGRVTARFHLKDGRVHGVYESFTPEG
jgi:hypothetical protein